jgi:hypothetical protein
MGNVGNCSRQNNAFEGPLSGFIPSYVPNSAEYDTLEDAKAAAQQFDNVGGSTKEPTGKFTLRAGNALMPSPAGSDEVSWRFIKEYPGCAKRFKGGHNAGQCVHGVGGNQQHYTCCGLTDVNAECPVKHLPLGVKLIKEFLNDAEQRAHVERLLQEPMVTKKGTLNFSPSLTIDKLDVVKNRGNEWLRRLTHGNDHQPFTWSNGHCYNGHSSWDPREVGSQPAHRAGCHLFGCIFLVPMLSVITCCIALVRHMVPTTRLQGLRSASEAVLLCSMWQGYATKWIALLGWFAWFCNLHCSCAFNCRGCTWFKHADESG